MMAAMTEMVNAENDAARRDTIKSMDEKMKKFQKLEVELQDGFTSSINCDSSKYYSCQAAGWRR